MSLENVRRSSQKLNSFFGYLTTTSASSFAHIFKFYPERQRMAARFALPGFLR